MVILESRLHHLSNLGNAQGVIVRKICQSNLQQTRHPLQAPRQFHHQLHLRRQYQPHHQLRPRLHSLSLLKPASQRIHQYHRQHIQQSCQARTHRVSPRKFHQFIQPKYPQCFQRPFLHCFLHLLRPAIHLHLPQILKKQHHLPLIRLHIPYHLQQDNRHCSQLPRHPHRSQHLNCLSQHQPRMALMDKWLWNQQRILILKKMMRSDKTKYHLSMMNGFISLCLLARSVYASLVKLFVFTHVLSIHFLCTCLVLVFAFKFRMHHRDKEMYQRESDFRKSANYGWSNSVVWSNSVWYFSLFQ